MINFFKKTGDRDSELYNIHSVEEKKIKTQNVNSWLLSGPVLFWLIFFFFIPFLIVTIYSFLTPSIYDIEFRFSLSAYSDLFKPIYLRPFLLSFRLAFLSTIICLLTGYPIAYYIARSSEKIKNFLLILIIIPFWTNYIIRIFSWRIFLSENGVLNQFMVNIGLLDTPVRFLRTDFAVIIVTVYIYLSYMILPLYSVLEKIDFTLLNSAMDLGATEFKSFMKITLPLSMEGIFAGIILVFIPALGTYIVPQLVGHQNSLFIGQLITYKIKSIPRNWPLASAMSIALLLLVTIVLLICYSIFKKVRNEKNI